MIPFASAAALRVAAFALASVVQMPGDLAAQAVGTTFVRRDDCIDWGKLTAEQCENAYRNARAEYEQKAPRFASRAACERSHKRCAAQLVATTGGWDALARGGATYVPRFIGIRISGEGASAKTFPIIEGAGRIAFSARQVGALDDKVAMRRPVAGGGGGSAATHANGPYVKRGDRDDTVRVPMQERKIGSDVAPGLYVDPDGVEWYKPNHPR